MSSLRRVMTTTAPASVILIRVVVGGVFFSEGIPCAAFVSKRVKPPPNSGLMKELIAD